ncbi:MAG: hypothetical protein MZV64_43090 [Ignavibacteriales bacterium]|nr:hypothetical protein [Ignavibacteriales bacterium]
MVDDGSRTSSRRATARTSPSSRPRFTSTCRRRWPRSAGQPRALRQAAGRHRARRRQRRGGAQTGPPAS